MWWNGVQRNATLSQVIVMSNFSICTDEGLTIESSDYTELRKKLMMGQLKQFLNVFFFSVLLMISCSTTSHLCSLRSGFFQHEPGQGLFWWSQHHRLPDHQPRQRHRPAVPPALGAPGWKRISRSQKHSTEGQWGIAADAAVTLYLTSSKIPACEF